MNAQTDYSTQRPVVESIVIGQLNKSPIKPLFCFTVVMSTLVVLRI